MAPISARFAPYRRLVTPSPICVPYLIDVSNWQGALTPEWFANWAEYGFSGIVVQAVTGSDGKCYTRQQLDAAEKAGWELNGYVWCSPGDSVDNWTIESKLSLFDGFHLQEIYLDLEQEGIDYYDVSIDLAIIDNYLGRADDVGIYTSKWVFDREGWSDQNYWPERKLWDANYDGDPDPHSNFVPYGGWHLRYMKQFTQDPLDQNCRA